MPPAALPGPALARTTVQVVGGVPATSIEARFSFDRDSPLIVAWPFLDWEVPAAPARASATRSTVVGAIIMASRRPLEDEMPALREMSFLTHEMSEAEASSFLYALDACSMVRASAALP